MQNKNFTVCYGNAVTVFPESAVALIINGKATMSDVRVLSALLSGGDSLPELCKMTSLSEHEINAALAFWRGAGVLSTAAPSSSTSVAEPSSAQVSPAAPAGNGANGETASPEKKKILLSRESRKYSGQEISAILERDGGKLREMIDECQQLIGHIFTPSETAIVLGLCDDFGLEADYVITLAAYCVGKKPKCSVKYLEKTAINLFNEDITTLDDLDAHIKKNELYDGVAGKLRSLIGIGGRAYTKKENGIIKHWVSELGYGIEIITLAYEICCDANSSFSFDYAGRILDNWYAAGVKTVKDAEAERERFKAARANGGGVSNGSPDLAKSFDAGEFFATALKRSYRDMTEKE